MSKVPGWCEELGKKYPKVLAAYEHLGEACRQAGLATTTIGFPAMMAALSWVEDVAKEPR
jgi:hypothetical protein